MQCPRCQRQIPADSLFCSSCGVRLEHRCPSCGFGVPLPARFCPRCGRALGEDVVADVAGPAYRETGAEGAAPPLVEAEGERRHLTVMFCDLVEWSKVARILDPEDSSEVIQMYRDTCAAVIDEFQGRVAQYLGDGIMAYFGYPQAHEDDPERAVLAGLRIVAEVARTNPQLESKWKARLAVRIGIDTGTVVIGGMGRREQPEILAVGHTPNLASRLQRVAPSNSVVISGETARLVRGLFITRDLGARSLIGIDDPVPIYHVVQPSGVRSRLDVAVAAGLTPLFGREPDLERLTQCWDRASKGDGQVVLIGGEPGIGKSRLVYALRDRLAERDHTWLECRGSPYHENSAFYPIIELLRQGLRITTDESAEEQAAKIEGGLERVELPPSEVVPLFTALLSIPLPARYTPLLISPEGQRRKTLEALAAWLFALARLQPTVLVIEDLHWSDPSSLELLGMLVERAASAPLLLVATFRPTFKPRWTPSSWLTRTTIGPLSPPQTSAMVQQIAGDRPFPPPVLRQVVEKTDGVPLFIEELTKSVLESAPIGRGQDGYAWQPSLSVPATLQDSLAARLDRLGAAKHLAQLAAVLGREFSWELLAAVSGADVPSLEEQLGEIVAAELLYPSRKGPNPSYTFKHALIQETAYESLLRSTRRAQHARIARVLEARFPERVESEPEEIARHCEEGGLTQQAISYYERAGRLAAMRSANPEAVGHLDRAIELLDKLPEGPERDQREIVLRDALGAPLVAAKGWGSSDAERSYGRARALCEHIGEAPQLFMVIRGLVMFYLARAELETAHELCNRLLRLSEGERDSSARLVAHEHMAILLYFKGDPAAALSHFERAFVLYDPIAHRSLGLRYGNDLGVFTRCFFSWNLWLLGYPDKARDRGREAVEFGVKAEHAFSHAYALLWKSILHVMRREREPAREIAEQAVNIAEEQGLGFIAGGARLIHGWACFDPNAGNEKVGQAIEEFQLGLAQLAQVGNQGCGPQILGGFADIHREAGRVEEALRHVDAALALSERTRQSFWDAELLRIKGELLLQRDGDAGGEGELLLRRALEVSVRQQAKSLELRAATSLCRLLRRRGDGDAARILLAPIYDWFSEGFDTPDLEEARDLLDELS